MFNFNIVKRKINGKNNKINTKQFNIYINGNGNEILATNVNIKKSKKVKIKIHGNNNAIKIGTNTEFRSLFSIDIKGDNNTIEIGNNVIVINNLNLQILENCQNGKITIGDKTSFWNTAIQTCDNNSSISIGEDCMFSYDTRILNCDGHSILQDGKLINKGHQLSIGNHCWIGYNAVIYKNSKLPDNTIVARGALVTSSFKSQETNIAIGGIPAKILKTNIEWTRKTPNETEAELGL